MAWNIATILKHLVPLPLYYTMRDWARNSAVPDGVGYALKYPDRRDVRRLVINEKLELHVFWKVLTRGRGPSFSLFACGDEILRLDCFGAGEGHYHAQFYCPETPTRSRLFFFEQTASEQVKRSVFEINSNLDYYLQRHPRKCVRQLQIDADILHDACQKGQLIAQSYLSEVPELVELSRVKTNA